jgi:hypothetical protein
MTVKMTELNGNEKYFRFSSKLPTNASNPGMIKVGDLMIYGQDTLVLFYKVSRPPTATLAWGVSTIPPGLQPHWVPGVQRSPTNCRKK